MSRVIFLLLLIFAGRCEMTQADEFMRGDEPRVLAHISGRVGIPVFKPLAVAGVCTSRVAWFTRDDLYDRKDPVYTWQQCLQNSDGTCPYDHTQNCVSQRPGEKKKVLWAMYRVDDPKNARNVGLDIYDRKVTQGLHNDDEKNIAHLMMIIEADGSQAAYCGWSAWPEGVGEKYDKDKDPKTNLTLCKAILKPKIRDKKPVINPQTQKPFLEPSCDGLLACIEKAAPEVKPAEFDNTAPATLLAYPDLRARFDMGTSRLASTNPRSADRSSTNSATGGVVSTTGTSSAGHAANRNPQGIFELSR